MIQTEIWLIILVHQILFQGLFFAKNIMLQRKLGLPVRGNNSEASVATIFFAVFIAAAFIIAFFNISLGRFEVLGWQLVLIISLLLMVLCLIISAASLFNLGDSWRVGVIEDQQTDLVTTGIYAFSRNPYFVSYIIMFAAYAIILQNLILFVATLGGIVLIHNMIRKEEKYLLQLHGSAYEKYKQEVPRYLFV